MAKYQLWYEDAAGTLLAPVPVWSALEYVLVVGDVGIARVTIPGAAKPAVMDTTPDRRVSIWRLPDNGALDQEVVTFGRTFTYQTDTDGLTTFVFAGNDPNELLRRRIVAYFAESAQAKQTNEADDMMRQIVIDNLLTDADYGGAETGRDLTAAHLSVGGSVAAGPVLSKGFSWRNVLEVLQDIQATSKSQGNEVFFGMFHDGLKKFAFNTRTGQWGRDRTTLNPIVFSLETGNLLNPVLTYDHTDEKSFIYGLGQGEASDRTIQEASDTDRINASLFGRNEAAAYANANSETAGVLAAARDELARRRPRTIFSGDIISTPGTPYGGDGWRLGDRVSVSYQGFQVDTVIRSVHVTVTPDGKETVSARVESVS